jgi:hypothetical protein
MARKLKASEQTALSCAAFGVVVGIFVGIYWGFWVGAVVGLVSAAVLNQQLLKQAALKNVANLRDRD